MQLTITGHHVEVTPALRAYVTEKMQNLVRHFDQVMSVDVILKVDKLDQIAEATVNAGGRKLFANDSAPRHVCRHRRADRQNGSPGAAPERSAARAAPHQSPTGREAATDTATRPRRRNLPCLLMI